MTLLPFTFTLLAAVPVADPPIRSVLVLPVESSPKVGREETETVRQDLDRALRGVQDVRFLATREDNRAVNHRDLSVIMHCGTVECAAELGLTAGVPEVLVGKLDQENGRYAVQLQRVSTRSVRVLQQSRRVASGSALASLTQALPGMVAELYPPDLACHPVSATVASAPPVQPVRVTVERDTASVLEHAVLTAPREEPPPPSYPKAPDVTWMFPALAGIGTSLAVLVLLGAAPLALSALIIPAASGLWYRAGRDLDPTATETINLWQVGLFMAPALIALPIGMAAPLAAGASAVAGWLLPTWSWRRRSPPLRYVVVAAMVPAVLGSVAAALPVALAALAAASGMGPGLAGRTMNAQEEMLTAGLWAGSWAAAAGLSWVTGLATFLIPPTVVGFALATDTTPLRKESEEEPLPLDAFLASLDSGGGSRHGF